MLIVFGPKCPIIWLLGPLGGVLRVMQDFYRRKPDKLPGEAARCPQALVDPAGSSLGFMERLGFRV